MKRYLTVLFTMLLCGSLIAACGSNDSANNDEAATDEAAETSNDEATAENSSGEANEALASDIPLRDHAYDEADEEIEDSDERENSYSKHGSNLTLPEDFPSDFPIADGMTVDSVIVGEPGSVHGDSIEIWFNDGGNYDVEQLYALYESYVQSDIFDDSETKDHDGYMTGLMAYEGIIDNDSYNVGVHPEDDYNVVTINILYDFYE